MAGVSSRTRSKNVLLFGVSSRTRSKNVPLFGCIPLVDSSKRRKSGLKSVSGSKKRKVEEEGKPFVVPENVKVISIDYDDGDEKGSEHCDERSVDVENKVKIDEIGENDEGEVKEESFVVPKNEKVISIDDDDKDEKGSVQCDEKMFEGCVDVEKEEQTEKRDEIVAKDGDIVDDDEDVDDSDEDDFEEEEEDDDDESEENETSDEDFIVDEVIEISESDDESSSGSSSVDDDDDDHDHDDEEEEEDDEEEKKKGGRKHFDVVEELVREVNDRHSESSYVDNDNDDGEEEEEEEEGEDKGEDLSKIWEECSNGLLEMVREVEDQKSEISDRNNEEVKIENSPSSVCNDVSEHASSLITFEKKGYFDPVKGCSSSKGNGESKKRESKSLGIKMQNVSNEYDIQFIADQPISFGHSKVHKGESNNANAKAKSKDDAKAYQNVNVGDSDEGKQKHVKGLVVGGVSSPQAKQEKMRDSDKPKMTENKEGDCKGRVRIRNGEKKESMDNNGLTKMFVPKELRLAKLLADCFWGNKNTMKKDSIVFEGKDGSDDRRDTRSPPVYVETPQSIWSLKKVEEVQKTKEEEEQEPLWDQMDTALRESEAESMVILLFKNI